ncbi:MAG: serine/threonine protein kinase [Rhodopirellula sp.]|nr:serine/threonine protein kinase [Rhodopirellula sp.]
MNRQHGWLWSVLLVASWAFMHSPASLAQDWPVWRGPTLDGHAPGTAVATVPLVWSENQNVAWRASVPGKGHASPIVVGGSVFLLTHEEQNQTICLLKYNASNGAPMGKLVLHRGVISPSYLHKKNTVASSTPSSDGKTVYVVAQVGDAIYASAVSVQGQLLWQRAIAPYRAADGWFGYGASPLLVGNALVVPVETDNREGGLFAVSKSNGAPLWRALRPQETGYSSPILAEIAGRPQILISGGHQVAAYQPQDGRLLWQVKATSRTTCGTMVWKNNMVFASGGFPEPGTYGVMVNKQGAEVVWQNRVKCYEQSMVVAGDYLYGFADNGIAFCWRCSDGLEMWKQRLGGPVSASPLLVGDRIYASNERGVTFVFRASPQGFQLLGENVLGDSSFASPIYADGKLFLRHASSKNGVRQEFLVAIAKNVK